MDNVKLLIGFIESSLETESLSVEVAALGVAGINLGHQVVSLGLPLANNLVKVAATLLGDHGSGVGALVLHGQLLQLSVHSGLGLLSRGNLGVEVLDVFLGLLDTRGQLGLATLELINTAKSFNLVLGFPELDLRLGLGQSLEGIILLLIFLVNAHAEILSLSHQALVLGEESSTVSGLTISQSLGVLQLGGQRDLVLLQSGDGILALLNLSGQVLRLNLELLLGGVSLIESSGKLIKLAIGLDNHSLAHLDILLHVGSISHGLLKTRSGLSKISLHTSLVLLRLGLVLVDGVNLFTQLAHAVVVLLSQGSQSSLMGNVGLFQVRLELGKFSLALLVQLHLESSVGASLLQPGTDVLQVTGEKSSVLLSLGTVSTLYIDLLIKLINTDLELLDLLGVFGGQSLLVLNLGSNGGNLLLLALDSLSKLRDDSFKIRNSLLGQLKVAFNLSLHLLSISLSLLLSLKSILTLIKRLLQLALDLAEVVASVLHGLDVLLSLLSALSSGLLVLAKLGDQILLVGNLITQGSDLTVLGHLVILAFLNGGLKILDLLPQADSLGCDLLASMFNSIDGVILTLDTLVGLINLLLQIISGILKTSGFVNDLLNSRSSRLESQNQLRLFSRKLGVDLNDSIALSNSLVNVGLSNSNLVLILLLVLAKLCTLEVGLDGQPDLHPQPGLGNHHGSDGSLASIQGHLLVLELLESHSGGLASSSGLQPGKNVSDLVLTELFHLT